MSCHYCPPDSGLLGQALFGVKKPTKKMVASMPWCCCYLRKEPLFPPTPHTLSWVDRNRGNISGHFSVKIRSGWTTDWRTPPRPIDATQVILEQSEKPSPAAPQCAWGSWHILSLLPSVLKGMVWWLIMHLTLHFTFIQVPWTSPPNALFIPVFSKVRKRAEHKNQSGCREISCSFFPFNLLKVPTSE